MKLRIATLLLTSAVLSSGLLSSPVATYADTLSQKQQQENEMKQQAQDTKSKINNLSSREASLQGEVENLQSQLGTLQQQIDATQADITQRAQEMTELKGRIANTQKQLTQQYGVLQQRLTAMYEEGSSSYLDVLFSATSFSDLLSRFQFLESIAQADNQMLKDIEATKNQLAAQSDNLKRQQAQQRQVYAGLVAKQAQQQQKQAQEQQLLTQVHNEKLTAQADLQQENAALSTLANEISQLQAQQGAYNGPVSGWTWPVPSVHSISSGFGWRILYGQKDYHPGIDIPGGAGGETVVAATAGQVLYAGAASGYGLWVVIESGGGLVEVYGHVANIAVQPGQAVSEGQPIATIGTGIEGNSTGPHLHFQVGKGGVSSAEAVSPLSYVSP